MVKKPHPFLLLSEVLNLTNIIKSVFSIIAVLLVSLVLWAMIFGATGRTIMWQAIEPAMAKHWSECTMKDGKVLSDTFSGVFESAPSYEKTVK